MSPRPQTVPPVPEETARIAHAAFPKVIFIFPFRDEIGILFDDADFADLFPTLGTACLCSVETGSDYHFPVCRESCPTARRATRFVPELIGNML